MGTSLRDGRYAVGQLLGEGAQGMTFAGTDGHTGQAVAIKRFDVRGAKGWKDVELAERETRVLATLDHPLLPRYVDHFEEDGALFLVMQRIEGETLEAMQRRGAVAEDEVWRFLSCADHALTYLHGRSAAMVHRDIKPRNVVRRPDGSYVLVDFGAVSERMKPRGGSTVVGTYGYMAPEQLQGRALPQTDVYAVGATAVAALTGCEPDALPHKGLRVDVRGALGGRVSEAMIATLERMLEPDPDLRAASLGQAFEAGRVRSYHPPAFQPQPVVALRAAAPTAAPTAATEDSLKGISKLLWILWGLGWVIVPTTLVQFRRGHFTPTIMFVWLAVTIVLTFNKNALLRRLVQELRDDVPRVGRDERQPSSNRVRVAGERVRVGDDLAHHEVVGETQVSVAPAPRTLASMRRS